MALRGGFLAAAAAVALLCAGPAGAAAPVTLGPTGNSNGEPDIAVDGSGRAHVTWYNGEGSSPATTRYCQLPRGGTGCVNPKVFELTPGQGNNRFGRPHVFLPGAGRVVLLETQNFDYGVRQSTDGGLNFGGFGEIGNVGFSGVPDEAVFGPGESVTVMPEVGEGAQVQNAPLSGSFQEEEAVLDPGGLINQGAVGLDGATPVAVYTDFGGTDDDYELSWRKYDGSGSINLASNWTPEQLIEDNQKFPPDSVSLAGGPSGLFLLYSLERPGNDAFVVRKFTGSSFGPAITVSDSTSLTDGDLTQDGGGRLHAVWNDNNRNDNLRWTFSDDGLNWTPPVTIHAENVDHFNPRVAAAPDHRGFAVWGEGDAVRAVPLEPLPTDGPGPGPGPLPVRDTVSPATSGLSVSDSTLKPGQGARFRFRSSEPGRALLVIDRAVAGLKLKAKGKRKASCFAETKKRLAGLRKQLAKRGDVKRLSGKRRAKKLRALVKKRRCTTWKKVTALRRGIQAGVNSIVFGGKVNGRALKSGRYRAVLIVTDAAGNASRKQVTNFKVLAKRKKGVRR